MGAAAPAGSSSPVWRRLLRQPQSLWVRRALFQVHLWTGIAAGIYVVLICVSGSALVFRNEISQSVLRGPAVVPVLETRLTEDELKAAAERAYPGYTVTDVWEPRRPNYAVELWLKGDGGRLAELFDPFTGKDLGLAESPVIDTLVWLADFHDNLFYDDAGRKVNGYLALVLVLTCVTGAIIWWPGVESWRRSLTIEWGANWKRLNWTLHSAIGFWAFLIVFGFAFTGFYLVFQEPFMAVVDYFEPASLLRGRRRLRTGDLLLRWFSRLHFGRFAWPLEALWVVLGLIPPVLFITGAVMWWNRVLGPAWQRMRRGQESPELLGGSET